MENLHLKNLDLTKIKKQVQENKIKSIAERAFSKITVDNNSSLIIDIDESNDENIIKQPSISHLIAHRFRG